MRGTDTGGQPAGNGPALKDAPPGIKLAVLLGQVAGLAKRYPGSDDDDVAVAAGRWDAIESWAAAQKLAAIRELIRRRPAAGRETRNGQLPMAWRKDLTEEVALELGITKTAADALIALAWALEVRLPLTAAALEAGNLNLPKARLIADETAVLSDEDAGQAEAMVAGKWDGKTWSQIRSLIARAVVNTDPEGAVKRREQAEREDARVRFWREHAGTAGLAGYNLPADRALRAMANVQNRARAYKRWGIPEPMQLLRVRAMLDLLTGTDSRSQFPRTAPGVGNDAQNAEDPEDTRSDDRAGHDPDDDDDGDGGPEYGDPGNGPAGDDAPGGRPGADDGLAANLDLTIPLRNLLGLTHRAGEAHGFGVLDPGLARRLAAEAAKNPRSQFRVIVTDDEGRAIGFGQASRTRRPWADKPPRLGQQTPGSIRGGTAMATFVPAGPGPSDGYGAWTLSIGPLGLAIKLAPIPLDECDHRFESKGYQPSDTLRRLVEIRDGECTMPVCVRHPRGCDWEHAVPWPTGRTCVCNGGARCRHDHIIKQSPDWKIEQLPGGYHRWTTPAGLTYTKGPREYPL